MSLPAQPHINIGAYERPYSGVGIEFDPLGIKPDRTELTLHETGFLPANADWNFPSVFSPFWRLYYNGRRGHCVLFGDRMIELTPAHLVLIPPNCLFHCLGTNPVPTFWIAFSFTHKLHRDLVPPVLLPPRDTERCLIRDLRTMVRRDRDWEPTDAIRRNSMALLQVVLSRPELRWQAPLPDNLGRVREFIDAQIGSSLSNPKLARVAGLSVEGFARSFRKYFETTPALYVAEMRVREAARLLAQTDDTIDAIAEATGFANRAYLSRVFKKLTGTAPASFRRTHSTRRETTS